MSGLFDFLGDDKTKDVDWKEKYYKYKEKCDRMQYINIVCDTFRNFRNASNNILGLFDYRLNIYEDSIDANLDTDGNMKLAADNIKVIKSNIEKIGVTEVKNTIISVIMSILDNYSGDAELSEFIDFFKKYINMSDVEYERELSILRKELITGMQTKKISKSSRVEEVLEGGSFDIHANIQIFIFLIIFSNIVNTIYASNILGVRDIIREKVDMIREKADIIGHNYYTIRDTVKDTVSTVKESSKKIYKGVILVKDYTFGEINEEQIINGDLISLFTFKLINASLDTILSNIRIIMLRYRTQQQRGDFPTFIKKYIFLIFSGILFTTCVINFFPGSDLYLRYLMDYAIPVADFFGKNAYTISMIKIIGSVSLNMTPVNIKALMSVPTLVPVSTVSAVSTSIDTAHQSSNIINIISDLYSLATSYTNTGVFKMGVEVAKTVYILQKCNSLDTKYKNMIRALNDINTNTDFINYCVTNDINSETLIGILNILEWRSGNEPFYVDFDDNIKRKLKSLIIIQNSLYRLELRYLFNKYHVNMPDTDINNIATLENATDNTELKSFIRDAHRKYAHKNIIQIFQDDGDSGKMSAVQIQRAIDGWGVFDGWNV